MSLQFSEISSVDELSFGISAPLGVLLDELVELKMHSSRIKRIWNGNQDFAKLKFIDLSYSEDLIQTPIVSGAPSLERLLLISCVNLVEVHPSVGQHKRLVLLLLKDCKNLQIMPRKLEMDSLEELILSGCSKIEKLPEFGDNMKSLSLLNVENCINLLSLPNSICNLRSLRKLYVSGCSRISTLPDGMNENESLEELYVSGTDIREIPSCLEKLRELSFGGRKETTPKSQNFLPPLSSLLALESLDLSYGGLTDESIPTDLGPLSLLKRLDLSGNNFVNPPAQCIISLSMFHTLSFNDCPRLESLPLLPPNLQSLYTTNCPKLKPFHLVEDTLWKIFELHSHEDPIEGPELWFITPGNEIPSWFNNQNFLEIDSSDQTYEKLCCDSVTSITVDVSEDFQLSEWWGIAVCLVLEPLNMDVPSSSNARSTSTVNEEIGIYYWVCKAPDKDPDPNFPIAPKFGHKLYKFKDPYIILYS
ncbi:TMV resistance protein N-like [Vigna umbellata]|uniref:TMV resistance protein N-like n=1 Tax=Vigna umbellata TaxID=87088 RepID=UPI001F5E3792|nr:TMV resistance protein N-like [Vigna umbellata]